MNYGEIILQTKSIAEPPAESDGFRVLVERHWPPGVSQEAVQLDLWLGDLAPSPGLRKWFNEDRGRWQRFLDRYFAELDARPVLITELFQKATDPRITLLFAAKDAQYNHAAALKNYLEGG